MPNIIEAGLVAKGKRFGIIASRFNDFITDRLVGGAIDALTRSGAKDADIDLVKVPGAFEIPMVALRMAKSNKYHAIVCLGAVIRGATPHFDYVCAEASKGIAQVSMETQVRCRSFSALSPQTASNKPSSGPAPKRATKVGVRLSPPSRWPT